MFVLFVSNHANLCLLEAGRQVQVKWKLWPHYMCFHKKRSVFYGSH